MGCCNPKEDLSKELPILHENGSRVKLELDNSVLFSSNSSLKEPKYNVKYRPRKDKVIKINDLTQNEIPHYNQK